MLASKKWTQNIGFGEIVWKREYGREI
jgi:hypothetical protein